MSRREGIELAPDAMKAFGIALVVFGHVLRGLFSAGIIPEDGVWASIDRMIYLFHMPLFFYASGLFVERSIAKAGYKNYAQKTALALLLPLIVWSYLQYSIQYMAGSAVNNPVDLFYVLTAPFPPRQQFWFLGSLFVISLSVGLLFHFRQSHKIIWCLIVLLFLIQAVSWGTIQTILAENALGFSLMQIVIHMPFFMLGIVWNTERMRMVSVPNAACLAIFVMSLWAYESLPEVQGWVHMITSVLCVLSIYKIAVNLTDGKTKNDGILFPILFVGMNSMIIYVAHVIAAAGFRVILMKLGVENIPAHLAGGFLIGFIGPLFLVPVGLKLAKYHPLVTRAMFPVRYERT